MNMKLTILAIASLGIALAGCGGGEAGASGPAAPPTGADPAVGGPSGATGAGGTVDLAKLAEKYKVTMAMPDAGVELVQNADPGSQQLRLLADNRGFRSRRDPFALLPIEKAFENAQRREKIFSEGLSFGNYYKEPDPVTREEEIVEPPPMGWRLAGILHGNGISAIMTNGTFPSISIQPGTQIPGTEWYVVSIDKEKATLRRRSKKLPREWVVTLQGSFGFGPTGGGGEGPAGGGPPAGGGKPGRTTGS